MKKAMLAALLCLAFAMSVFAGVTEIKIYSNENTQRYYQLEPVGPDRAANYLGTKPGGPHVNSLVARIGMNNDVDATKIPPDSNEVLVTHDAAIGPYAIKYHFVTMPNPRTWYDIQRDDTPGYTQYLDVSATQRITFWIKGVKGCKYPLWFMMRCKNHPVDGGEIISARVPIDGELVIHKDVFGYHFLATHVPFTGDWQFVSIPLDFLQLTTAAEVQAVVPYSWAGVQSDGKRIGPDFNLAAIKTMTWDTKEGGQVEQGNYPWPENSKSIGVSDYWLDEIVFTMNEGSGVTDVNGNQTVMPLEYTLGNNYPNPFNPTTSFSYAIPVSNQVTLAVYNATGTLVRTLVNEFKSAGTYTASWDGKDENGRQMPSGIYFYQMKSSHFNSTKKMLLTK